MRWALFAFTAPAAVASWVVGLLSILVGIAHRPRFEQAAVLSLELREWFATGTDNQGSWRWSTTLVRTIWWQPHARDFVEALDEPIERHETVHLRQWEDYMLLSWLVGLGAASWLWSSGDVAGGFELWFWLWCSGALWHVPNFVTAAARFGLRNLYRDSEHERSAYAQTTPRALRAGESWWEAREREREQQIGL